MMDYAKLGRNPKKSKAADIQIQDEIQNILKQTKSGIKTRLQSASKGRSNGKKFNNAKKVKTNKEEATLLKPCVYKKR